MSFAKNHTGKRKSITCTMTRLFVFVTLALLCTGASAIPIINGSTYEFVVFETDPFLVTANGTATVDGVAEMFPVTPTGTVTVNETETDLGGGLFLIQFLLNADADLFGGPGFSAFFNIGGFANNSVDLVSNNFIVQSNTLRYLDISGAQIGSASFPSENGVPWDGFYLAPLVGGGIGPISTDIRTIELSYVLARVPTPTTLSLFALGLAFLLRLGQRRQRVR